jgi:anti-sigma regulatory factor (Ser/Thr protein kinase)
MAENESVLARIGGPTLLVGHQFFIFGAPIVVAIALAFGPELTLGGFSSRLLAGLALLVVVWSVAELGKATLFRHRNETPVKPILVAAFGAGLGALVIVVSHYVEASFGIGLAQVTLGTFVAALFIGAGVVVVSSWVEILRIDYRDKQRRLMASVESTLKTDDIYQRSAATFDFLASAVSRQLAKSKGNGSAPEAIDEVIANCIKPLARGGFARQSIFEKYFVLRGVTQDAVILRPFQVPLITAALYGVLIFVPNQFHEDDRGTLALYAALVDFVIVSAWLALAKILLDKFINLAGRRALLAYLGTFAALSVVTTSVNQSLFWSEIAPLVFAAGLAVNFSALTLCSILVSILRLWRANPTPNEPRLKSEQSVHPIGGSMARAVESVVERRLTRHLHSTVQNRVLALRIGYSEAAQFDPIDLEEKILTIISEAKQEFLEQQVVSLSEKMDKLKEEWSPVVTINFANNVAYLSSVQQSVLFMALQECVTNSVRHGLATTVDIYLEEGSSDMPNSYRLRVTDDGVGPVGRRLSSGVGMRLLGELSDGSVELGFAPNGGALLEALIRC